MRISSKILAVMSLMVFALLSQSASACYYPDGNCGGATEAAPAAEDAAPAEEAAPAAEATEEAAAEED